MERMTATALLPSARNQLCNSYISGDIFERRG